MTEADARLAAQWEERYQEIYRTTPGGFLEWMAPRIEELDTARNTLIVRFETKNWMTNPRGTVHGGVIASMADTATGMLSRIVGESQLGGPTVSLSVNYIRAVPLNESVLVRTVCQKSGRQMIFMTSEAYLPGKPEEILFTAECTYLSGKIKI